MELLDLQRIGEDLTRRQRKFAHCLIKHGNGAKAAREAGYSPMSAKEIASENLTKANVQDYIKALEAEAYDVEQITPELIKKMIMEDAVNGDGATALRAKELLGRTKGMFKDVQVTPTESQTDAELLETVREVFGDELADKAAEKLGVTSMKVMK